MIDDERLKSLRGLLRLGQVRNAIKSSKSEALGSPIYFLAACFGQKFERTVFKRTNLSQIFFVIP
jgi:hypothetical protein